MGVPQREKEKEGGRMEGWLYLIGSNRFGLHYSRKRYFVLQDNCLKNYRSAPPPLSKNQDPVRSAIIDSCIRVNDNGRESIHGKVLFVFTLYNTSNHSDRLKFGASSPEEAAKWIRSFQEDASSSPGENIGENILGHSRRKWRSKVRSRTNSIDWTNYSFMNSDVVAPSDPWTIFGCQNGLRMFKEAGTRWNDHPAIMAVGVVDGTSEAVFRALMSLGPSRSEYWDFCLSRGSVVEHLDGHNDIVRQQLNKDWLPWGMKPRDLLLRRYWRREDDGTYVILYHSVFHRTCPPQNGYVRACLKSGGYVITPVNQGKQSIVKHMLAIDWRFWKSYLLPSSARSITIRMLARVAALREYFCVKQGEDIGLPRNEINDIKIDAKDEAENRKSEEASSSRPAANLGELDDAADDFFDAVPEMQDQRLPRLSTAANLVKKLHGLAGQKKGYMDLQDMEDDDAHPCYGATLPKDSTCNSACSWTMAEPSTFLIRGSQYLIDQQKVKARSTLMQMVGADWLGSDKKEDHLAGRPGSIVQKYAARGGPEFFFVVNIQVPGATMYNLALYYMMNTPVEDCPLLASFINGDDGYRNSRFKLIPYISKGSWIVKQSVGKKACLVGRALEIKYSRGKNYIELMIDVGSSTVARGVVSLVLGYLNNLVIEMAFVIQGNTQEELPEVLIGTCRLNHLDASKSVLVKE